MVPGEKPIGVKLQIRSTLLGHINCVAEWAYDFKYRPPARRSEHALDELHVTVFDTILTIPKCSTSKSQLMEHSRGLNWQVCQGMPEAELEGL